MKLDFLFQTFFCGTGINSNKVPDDKMHANWQGFFSNPLCQVQEVQKVLIKKLMNFFEHSKSGS